MLEATCSGAIVITSVYDNTLHWKQFSGFAQFDWIVCRVLYYKRQVIPSFSYSSNPFLWARQGNSRAAKKQSRSQGLSSSCPSEQRKLGRVRVGSIENFKRIFVKKQAVQGRFS